MLFCPQCGNTLLLEHDLSRMQYFCQTCPYLQPIGGGTHLVKKLPLARKKVDDVLGGANQWANVDQVDATCADTECNGRRAYFLQVQIRSADEPSTVFYKCCVCAKTWRVG